MQREGTLTTLYVTLIVGRNVCHGPQRAMMRAPRFLVHQVEAEWSWSPIPVSTTPGSSGSPPWMAQAGSTTVRAGNPVDVMGPGARTYRLAHATVSTGSMGSPDEARTANAPV